MELSIFHDLKTLTSIKDKEALLSKYKNDEYIAELLYRALNPHMLFYIESIPTYVANPIGLQGKLNYKAFTALTDRLSGRAVTGNEAIEEVRQFFMNSHAEEAGIYENILLKGPIGVTATTVNKIWNRLIPEFKVMLGCNEIVDPSKLRYPQVYQLEYSGFRTIYKQGTFYSETGKIFENVNIPVYFNNLVKTEEYVLDGELYSNDYNFEELQNTINTENGVIPISLKYIVYDCMKVKNWELQSCNVPYEQRLKKVRELVTHTIADTKKVIDVESYIVNSSGEAVNLYKSFLKRGYEGGVIKDPMGLYKWGRATLKSGELLKMRPILT